MASRYFVGPVGETVNWDWGYWSASSGGASGASVPTASDDVFFDTADTLCALSASITVKSLTMTNGWLGGGNYNVTVNGNGSFTGGDISMIEGTIKLNATTAGASTINGTFLSSYYIGTIELNKTTSFAMDGALTILHILKVADSGTVCSASTNLSCNSLYLLGGTLEAVGGTRTIENIAGYLNLAAGSKFMGDWELTTLDPSILTIQGDWSSEPGNLTFKAIKGVLQDTNVILKKLSLHGGTEDEYVMNGNLDIKDTSIGFDSSLAAGHKFTVGNYLLTISGDVNFSNARIFGGSSSVMIVGGDMINENDGVLGESGSLLSAPGYLTVSGAFKQTSGEIYIFGGTWLFKDNFCLSGTANFRSAGGTLNVSGDMRIGGDSGTTEFHFANYNSGDPENLVVTISKDLITKNANLYLQAGTFIINNDTAGTFSMPSSVTLYTGGSYQFYGTFDFQKTTSISASSPTNQKIGHVKMASTGTTIRLLSDVYTRQIEVMGGKWDYVSGDGRILLAPGYNYPSEEQEINNIPYINFETGSEIISGHDIILTRIDGGMGGWIGGDWSQTSGVCLICSGTLAEPSTHTLRIKNDIAFDSIQLEYVNIDTETNAIIDISKNISSPRYPNKILNEVTWDGQFPAALTLNVYDSLLISGASTMMLGGDLYVENDLTVAESLYGEFEIGIAFNKFIVDGNFIIGKDSQSQRVKIGSSSDQSIIGGNLIVSATGDFNPSSEWIVNGDTQFLSGSQIDFSNIYTFTFGGNYKNIASSYTAAGELIFNSGTQKLVEFNPVSYNTSLGIGTINLNSGLINLSASYVNIIYGTGELEISKNLIVQGDFLCENIVTTSMNPYTIILNANSTWKTLTYAIDINLILKTNGTTHNFSDGELGTITVSANNIILYASEAPTSLTQSLSIPASGYTTFFNGTFKVLSDATLDWNGKASNVNTLRGDGDVEWFLIVGGSVSPTGTYLAVKDSNASGGMEINALSLTNTNLGGNTNWLFSDVVPLDIKLFRKRVSYYNSQLDG